MTLLAQYKSSVGITLNGGDVSAWADQSGNGNDLEQLTAIDQPLFVADFHNGHPVVSFDASEFMTALNNTMNDITTSDMTVVLVWIPKSVTGESIIIRKAASFATGPGYFMERGTNANRPLASFADGVSKAGWEGTALTDFINHAIIQSRFNTTPNTANLHVNGSADEVVSQASGTVTGSLTSTPKFQLGNAAGFGMDGDVLEIRIYDSGEDLDAEFAELDFTYSNPPGTIPPAAGSSSFAKLSLLLDDL